MSDFTVFPNGTAFMDWADRNCNRCWKGPKEGLVGTNTKCAIENAISIGSFVSGVMTNRAIAKRLNWDGKTYLTHDCPEREETRITKPPLKRPNAQQPELPV